MPADLFVGRARCSVDVVAGRDTLLDVFAVGPCDKCANLTV
jgi:hypothetical protein